jgi:hypothetical protein
VSTAHQDFHITRRASQTQIRILGLDSCGRVYDIARLIRIRNLRVTLAKIVDLDFARGR